MINSRQVDLIAKDCSELLTNVDSLRNLKNEKILITGGAGYIGSWLIEMINYLNTNFSFNTSAYILDPKASELKKSHPHLFTSNLIEIINQDVRQLAELPKDTTWIIHAAATPDNRIHLSNPLSVIDTIVGGTGRILEVATLLPELKKFVNLSSGLVYGRHNLSADLISENSQCNLNCSSVIASYAESKRIAETITHVYRSQFRMPIVNLRPFAFIGPYQLLDRPWAINNFLKDALNGGPIRILGNENTIRSYMYPTDMAYWILHSLTNADDGLTINLGSPEGRSLRNVAEVISRNLSSNPAILSNTSQQDSFASSFVPSTDKARETLGLELTVNFENAIKKTINWFQLQD